MGNQKQAFIDALEQELPGGVSNFLTTELPVAPSVDTPTTEEAAVLAQGVLAKYLLDVFYAFSGITPVDLILRIGQQNAVLKSMLLAGLQFVGEVGEHSFTILEPISTHSYAQGEQTVSVEITEGLIDLHSVVCQVTAPSETSQNLTLYEVSAGSSDYIQHVDFDEDGTWSFLFLVRFDTSAGVYSATNSTTCEVETQE